jgi:hypothetical protein
MGRASDAIASKAAASGQVRHLVGPDERGLSCQTSSFCYLLCTCALLASHVSTFLAVNMFCIFVFSLYYRWLMHHPAPNASMLRQFPLAKKLDGLFIMHMSVSWATGSPALGFALAYAIVFVLGDPHKLRALVFLACITATSVSLYRFDQLPWLYAYTAFNLLGLGAFVQHYVDDDRWSASRLWRWHGGTAIAFAIAVVGIYDAAPSTMGYPVNSFTYLF